jgi:hypothetical protein
LWRLRGTAECNDRIGGLVAENWAAAESLLGVVVDIFLGEAEGEVNRIRKQKGSSIPAEDFNRIPAHVSSVRVGEYTRIVRSVTTAKVYI